MSSVLPVQRGRRGRRGLTLLAVSSASCSGVPRLLATLQLSNLAFFHTAQALLLKNNGKTKAVGAGEGGEAFRTEDLHHDSNHLQKSQESTLVHPPASLLARKERRGPAVPSGAPAGTSFTTSGGAGARPDEAKRSTAPVGNNYKKTPSAQVLDPDLLDTDRENETRSSSVFLHMEENEKREEVKERQDQPQQVAQSISSGSAPVPGTLSTTSMSQNVNSPGQAYNVATSFDAVQGGGGGRGSRWVSSSSATSDGDTASCCESSSTTSSQLQPRAYGGASNFAGVTPFQNGGGTTRTSTLLGGNSAAAAGTVVSPTGARGSLLNAGGTTTMTSTTTTSNDAATTTTGSNGMRPFPRDYKDGAQEYQDLVVMYPQSLLNSVVSMTLNTKDYGCDCNNNWYLVASGREEDGGDCDSGVALAPCPELDLVELNKVGLGVMTHLCADSEAELREVFTPGVRSLVNDRHNQNRKQYCDVIGCGLKTKYFLDEGVYGPGAGNVIDTEKPFEMAVWFETADNTADGELRYIRVLFQQEGREFETEACPDEGWLSPDDDHVSDPREYKRRFGEQMRRQDAPAPWSGRSTAWHSKDMQWLDKCNPNELTCNIGSNRAQPGVITQGRIKYFSP